MVDPITFVLQHGPHGPHGPHQGPMGPAGGAGGMGGGYVWGLVWVLFVVAVVAIALYLVFRLAGEQEASETGDDALAVLERRYARGEIDDDEFEQRRTRLTERAHH